MIRRYFWNAILYDRQAYAKDCRALRVHTQDLSRVIPYLRPRPIVKQTDRQKRTDSKENACVYSFKVQGFAKKTCMERVLVNVEEWKGVKGEVGTVMSIDEMGAWWCDYDCDWAGWMGK